MRKITAGIALALVLLTMSTAQASEFRGGYLGGKIGYNTNSPTTTNTANKSYLGAEAGYGWDKGDVLLGVDGFADGHNKSITGRDYGVDVKLGVPMNNFMPYVKLGVAGSNPGARVHGGLGMEYKLAPHWSVVGEWTADSKNVNSQVRKNSNISVGINYYFNAPDVVPAVAVEVEPDVIPQPEPVDIPAPEVAEPAPAPEPVIVNPAPATAPVQKTIFTDKPVTIAGASFADDSARLKPTASKQLDEVAGFSVKYKDANFKVVGYTDNSGNEKADRVMSVRRAESVKAYLVNKGVDAKRIIATGRSSAMPIGDNKTAEGRAQNRRVEIYSVERVVR